MRHRLRYAALIGAVVAVAAALPAHAQTTYRATVSPTTVDFPRTRQLTYRLEITTGDLPERLELDLAEPSWPRRRAGEPEGSPLDLGEPRLEGTGTLALDSILHLDYGAGVCFRGAAVSRTPRYRLALPARTRSAIAVTATVSRDPPWPGTDYRVTFVIDRGRLKLRSPQPRLTGRRGVRIQLWTRPRTAPFFDFLNFGRGAVLRPARGLSIRGRTHPAIGGQLVGIYVAHGRRRLGRFEPDRSRLLARVRANRRGRFSYRWRPRRPGAYHIHASYRRQRERLASDVSCPLGFRVRR